MTLQDPPLPELFDDNRQFAESLEAYDTSTHAPSMVSVSCCDARVPQGELFGNKRGEHFTVANIGNSVRTRGENGEPVVAGSVVYPIEKTDPELAIVVGHTDCGAVTAAYQQVAEEADREDRELQNELDLLVPHIERGLDQIDISGLDRDEIITRLVEYNVDRQVDALRGHTDQVTLIGVVCDLHGYYPGESGQVHLVNYEGDRAAGAVPERWRSSFHRHLDD